MACTRRRNTASAAPSGDSLATSSGVADKPSGEGSGLISQLELHQANLTELSVDAAWPQISSRFHDRRRSMCLLCQTSDVLTVGWHQHCFQPQHHAREGLALEMLRRNRGTPAQVVARWWHLLDDDFPTRFPRIKSLLPPLPGNPPKAAVEKLTRRRRQKLRAALKDDGSSATATATAASLLLHDDHLRRTAAIDHGVTNVTTPLLEYLLEQRRQRWIYVVKFLKDQHVLVDCFGDAIEEQQSSQSSSVGRNFYFEKHEWVGDNYGKITVFERLQAFLPACEGGLRGRLGMTSSLIDSNEGLARAFDFLRLEQLVGSTAKSDGGGGSKNSKNNFGVKFRADVIEAMRGELFAVVRSRQLSWGEHDCELAAPLPGRGLRAIFALAEHALHELDHLMLLAQFMQVLRTVEELLRREQWPVSAELTAPFLPIFFNTDSYRVTRSRDAQSKLLGLSSSVAAKQKQKQRQRQKKQKQKNAASSSSSAEYSLRKLWSLPVAYTSVFFDESQRRRNETRLLLLNNSGNLLRPSAPQHAGGVVVASAAPKGVPAFAARPVAERACRPLALASAPSSAAPRAATAAPVVSASSSHLSDFLHHRESIAHFRRFVAHLPQTSIVPPPPLDDDVYRRSFTARWDRDVLGETLFCAENEAAMTPQQHALSEEPVEADVDSCLSELKFIVRWQLVD